MRAARLLLVLFCLSASAQAPKSPKEPKPFPVAVGQPAFIGEPIWVTDTTPRIDAVSLSGRRLHTAGAPV